MPKALEFIVLRVFKQIKSIFTLEHRKPCKTAFFIAFIRKTLYIYVLQYLKLRDAGFKSL